MFGPLGLTSLGGKRVNELIHVLCKSLRISTRVAKKNIQYIRLKFIETVNRAMPLQYSELIFFSLSKAESFMLIRQEF